MAALINQDSVRICGRYFHAHCKDTVSAFLFPESGVGDRTQTLLPPSFYSSGINRRPVCPITYDIQDKQFHRSNRTELETKTNRSLPSLFAFGGGHGIRQVGTFPEVRTPQSIFTAASERHPGLPYSDGRRDRTLAPNLLRGIQERRRDHDWPR